MKRWLRCLLLAALATVLGSAACSAPDNQPRPLDLPDRASFVDSKVSLFMEVRCGSLDCHGQTGRPLRLYGQTGLRLRATDSGARDNSPTTDEERSENYRSVVGLEPEALEDCLKSKGEHISTFQLLKKPLGIENAGIRHGGGPVLRPSEADPGWQCLFGWASGRVDPAQCESASKITP